MLFGVNFSPISTLVIHVRPDDEWVANSTHLHTNPDYEKYFVVKKIGGCFAQAPGSLLGKKKKIFFLAFDILWEMTLT